MLAIIRGIIVILYTIIVVTFGMIYCMFSPRNPKHVMTYGRLFGKLSHIFGIKLVERFPKEAKSYGPSIYIGNHQNNFDMVTMSNAVQPNTVTVGKKSLVFIPFFGQLYWITGNILIDRGNRSKAHSTITQVAEQIKEKKSLYGCSLKEHVAEDVVYYLLKQGLSMRRCKRGCLLCLFVSLLHKVR